jgi:hypothetical protein
MFLISVRVPSSVEPLGRSETFASQRNWPFSRSASELQRHAGAVQVHVGLGGRSVVNRLAGVFLHVDAGDPDPPGPLSVHLDLDPASGREGLLVLRDLIALGKVGIEVVLASEDRARMHLAVGREPGANGVLHRHSIQDRQRTREREADRAGVVVGIIAVADGAGAEELRPGAKMNVHLESDHRFVVGMHVAAHRGSGGRCR